MPLQISTCPLIQSHYLLNLLFFSILFQSVSSPPSAQCFKCHHTAAESKISVWKRETMIDRDRRGLKRSSEQQLYTTHSVGEPSHQKQRKERKKTLPPTPNQPKTCIYIVSIQPCLLCAPQPCSLLLFKHSHIRLCVQLKPFYIIEYWDVKEQNFCFGTHWYVPLSPCTQPHEERTGGRRRYRSRRC